MNIENLFKASSSSIYELLHQSVGPVYPSLSKGLLVWTPFQKKSYGIKNWGRL